MKTNTKKSLIALAFAAVLAIPSALAVGEPQNVSGLTATTIDQNSIGLSWNTAKDASDGLVDHYKVYYGKISVQTAGSGEYASTIDTLNNDTNYVATGLAPSTTYYFSVTAIDSGDLESESYSIESSATTSAAPTEDVTSPSVSSVDAVDISHVKVVFSEAVKLPELLPEAAFSIAEQINPAKSLDIVTAMIDPSDASGATVLLNTADQSYNVNYIVTAGVAIQDKAGNPIISGSTDSGLFLGSNLPAPVMEAPVVENTPVVTSEPVADTGAEAVCGNKIVETDEQCDDGNLKNNDGCADTCQFDTDTTPPEDITKFLLSFKAQVESFMIVMNWTASINSYGDLVDQILYQSMDKGMTYDAGTALGKDSVDHSITGLEGGKEYTFKITTKDATGNESVGVVKSIRLPQTGAGVGLLLFGSAALARRGLKRKKK